MYYVQELLSIYYYRHNIQNSLKYTLSNGCVEGTNNKIKVIKRTSYGYRNFYHLRSRIILSTAHNNMKNEAYRPLLFTEEDAIKKYEEENQKQLEMQNKIV
ncbi:transposase [Dolosigranulum pigrum]|nr:transposase [Dolosigranulum pigrum]QTJ35572.1 transposase [Dolosigranulum pigrum]QTJ50834.1 transposase [Dolosigranulum pigrum]